MFGIRRYWHKRIIRAGPNTLQPYRENPPDRVIGADDIVFADFGPIFEEWEADFGRTFVLGDDPVKHRLAADQGRRACQRRSRGRHRIATALRAVARGPAAGATAARARGVISVR
jgi:Xaa-Pro aminopeptidase